MELVNNKNVCEKKTSEKFALKMFHPAPKTKYSIFVGLNKVIVLYTE